MSKIFPPEDVLKNLMLFVVCCLMFSGLANATSVTVDFPSAGTSYFSATNGSGIITPGGTSALMWTAGDYVEQTFTGTGLASVSSISSVSWPFTDTLNGYTENVYLYLNGTAVAQFFAPDVSGNSFVSNVTGDVNFASIAGAGTYTLELILENTIPSGGGAISFNDGGQTTLSGAATVPEPSTLLLLGAGLSGLALLKRKARK
jgi:hypothetical protein